MKEIVITRTFKVGMLLKTKVVEITGFEYPYELLKRKDLHGFPAKIAKCV